METDRVFLIVGMRVQGVLMIDVSIGSSKEDGSRSRWQDG